MRGSLTAVALGLIAGCASSVRRQLAAEVPALHGIVRAEHPQIAQRVAAWLDEDAPRVRALLPDSDSRPLDVRVLPALDGALAGLTHRDGEAVWIELRADRLDDAGRRALAHEIVHASLGASWRTLPSVVEEGLCEFTADLVLPAGSGDTGARHPFEPNGLESPSRALALAAPSDPTREARDARRALDVVGRIVVERIGPNGLHVLCMRAEREGRGRVPSRWICAAAGLDGDDWGAWRDAARAQR